MDCSICFDQINAETGKVVLSCSHTFHLKCITRWFYEQEVETCPYCRRETCEMEKMPLETDFERNDQDDQDEDDAEFWREVDSDNPWVHLPNGQWVRRLEIPPGMEEDFEPLNREPSERRPPQWVRLPHGQWVRRLEIPPIEGPVFPPAPTNEVYSPPAPTSEVYSPQVRHAALVIQSAYINYRLRQEAAKTIQKIVRGFLVRRATVEKLTKVKAIGAVRRTFATLPAKFLAVNPLFAQRRAA